MGYLIIGIAIGIIIGWKWPQPPWARDIDQRITALLTGRQGPPNGPGRS